jgi:hypothetical protein
MMNMKKIGSQGVVAIIAWVVLLSVSEGCVVRGPVAWQPHRHAPHRFFNFKYWASPFGYPYGASGRTPLIYRAPKAGRRKERKRRWPKHYVPHPAYYKVKY